MRWVDVTPLVFFTNSAVGFVGIAAPAFIRPLLPGWAQSAGSLVAMAIPATLALLGWRAYSASAGRMPSTSVGWLAFWAVLAWPVCVFGVMLAGLALVSPHARSVEQDRDAGEILVLLLFVLGSGLSVVVCWLLSRRIVQALWPKPSSRPA